VDKLAVLCLSIPITLILDNARYQKCHLVEEHAKKLGIQLLYLPSYSPHLNLIERLWKFVRNECFILGIMKPSMILRRRLLIVLRPPIPVKRSNLQHY
jgi:hypothetical protein